VVSEQRLTFILEEKKEFEFSASTFTINTFCAFNSKNENVKDMISSNFRFIILEVR
jgi:hypothetical protein